VLLGTLYPLALDALGLGKISVGPPYFDTVFMPLMAPAIFLMGIGPMARWKSAELPDLARRLRWAFGVAIAAAVASAWLAGEVSLVGTLGLLMAFWIVGALATHLWEQLRPTGSRWADVPHRLGLIPRAQYGMLLAHLGVAVFCFGVAMVKTHEVERDVKMEVGDSTTVRGNTFTFRGAREIQGPNYVAMQGQIDVTVDGRKVNELRPEKRIYRVQQNPMTEAAIDTGFTRDLYVALGESVDGGSAWIVRVYVKPFIDWIWGGAFMMALGGLLAATDRRYRARKRSEVELPAHVGAAT
jgi:cytochrome c-type biogenesis protein CcmF